MNADELIAAKMATPLDMPSAEALAELKKLLAYNDGEQAPQRRVGWQSAVELLATHGFICGRERLNRVCRALGRKSWSTK